MSGGTPHKVYAPPIIHLNFLPLTITNTEAIQTFDVSKTPVPFNILYGDMSAKNMCLLLRSIL